jgi:zinc protease
MQKSMTPKLRHFAALLASTACVAPPHAAQGAPASFTAGVRETHLPNGLTVLTLENHASPVTCTYVYYRVGSRNETPGLTGVSHQLEHMMFKGTKKQFPHPGYIDLLVGRHGGVNNAETTSDYTDYYLLTPSDQLDLSLKIEADRMTEAAIDPAQLTAEKRVVLSELEGDENQNSSYLYDHLRAAAFEYHPYHYPVIGTKFDVKHYSRDQVYGYYKRHYCPNNATLVIVGDFKTDAVLARVKSLWKDVKPQPLDKTPLNPEPQQRGERRVTVRRAGSTAYVDIAFHIPPAVSPDLPALDVLSTLLTTGRSSILYRALVESRLATAINSGANYGLDPELFEITATASDGVKAADVEKAITAELEKVKTQLISAHDLMKARNLTRAGFVFGSEGVQALANRLGYFQTVMGSFKRIDTYLAAVERVTPDEIARVARKYLSGDNRTVAVFEPNGEKADPSADAGGGSRGAHYRPTVKRAAYSSLTEIPQSATPAEPHTVGNTIVKKLPNGVTVIVRENHAVPTVYVEGFVRGAGSVDDPAGQYGVAALTASLLTRGTLKRTSSEFAAAMDFIGATVSSQARRERLDFSAAMLKENFHEVVTALGECITSPSLLPDEVEKAKSEQLTAIGESENDTASTATKELYLTIYRNNPNFGHPTAGSTDSVRSLSEAEVRAFYRKNVLPIKTTVVIVGDVDTATAFKEAEAAFGDWRVESSATPSENGVQPALPTRTDAGSLVMVPMKDKSQDDVAMGLAGISRLQPGYEAAQLMNLVLGGDDFVGRVGKRIRDTEGLAYYAVTGLTPALGAGPWIFRAGVNPENVRKAINSAREEIAKMAAHGVTPEELAWARDNSIGGMQLAVETNSGTAASLMDAAFFGLGLDYSARYPTLVRKITQSEVNHQASLLLKTDKLITVVAGPSLPEAGASNKARNNK